MYARIESWSQEPFVDVKVVDAAENPQGCPDSHPDELIYEVWMGTMGLCDGLETEDKNYKEYKLGKTCDKSNPREDSKYDGHMESYSVWGINPSIMNVVKGARYCGKRGYEPFSKAIRPVYKQSENQYKCPDGHVPCNGGNDIDDVSAQYVVCRPTGASENDYCPITSFALDINSVDPTE